MESGPEWWRFWAVGLLAARLCGTVAADAPLDVQGHRGCGGLRPENTLTAFRHAISLGVTTLELDVRSTRDGVLVVHHDPRIDRRRCVDAAGRRVRPRRLADLDHADLSGGACDPAIPTLEQVFDLARQAGYAVRLSLELKVRDSGLPAEETARRVLAAVRGAGLERRAMVQSFSVEALRSAARLAPQVPRAVLVRKRRHYRRLFEQSEATVLSPRHGALRRRDVEWFRGRGVGVIPWTVNEPEEIRRLISWGVSGIISDYPDRVLRILHEKETDGASVQEELQDALLRRRVEDDPPMVDGHVDGVGGEGRVLLGR